MICSSDYVYNLKIIFIYKYETHIIDSPPAGFAAIVVMNTVALSLSFGVSLCAKLKRQSAVSVAIESSNQNAPLAVAILLLSLEEGYDRDLALNVPVIYMLTNILFVLIFGITLRRTGWLQIDDEDETMTLGKIVRNLKEKRFNNRHKNGNGDVEEEIDVENGIKGEKVKDESDDIELNEKGVVDNSPTVGSTVQLNNNDEQYTE